MEFSIVAKFEGQDAENHRIRAYEGAQSLQGISRGFVLIQHYLVTGTIRKRSPFSDSVRFYLEPPRQGSLDALFTAIIQNPEAILGGAIGVQVTASLITDSIKAIFSRAIGRGDRTKGRTFQEIENTRPGDVDALVDAVEPALHLGHTAIDNGAEKITLIAGDNRLVGFDAQTKAYINQSDMSELDERLDVSVGSLNVNTGYGRVYIREIGKTVPFVVAREADHGTYGALSGSLSRYARGIPSDVSIRFRQITAPDGRIKKFIILGAEEARD